MGPSPEAPLPPQTWLQHGSSSDSPRHTALWAARGPFSKAAGPPSPVNTGPTKLPLRRRYSGTGLEPGGRWGGHLGARLSILDMGPWMSCSWSAGSVRPRSSEWAGTRATPETLGRTRTWHGRGQRPHCLNTLRDLLCAKRHACGSHTPSHFILTTTPEEGTMISPLSERRKWRLREMSSLAQGQTGSRRQVPASVSPQSLGSY